MPLSTAVPTEDHDVGKISLKIRVRVSKLQILEGINSKVIVSPPTLAAITKHEEGDEVRWKLKIDQPLRLTDRLERRGGTSFQSCPQRRQLGVRVHNALPNPQIWVADPLGADRCVRAVARIDDGVIREDEQLTVQAEQHLLRARTR